MQPVTKKGADKLVTEMGCRVTLNLIIRVSEITLEKLRRSIHWSKVDRAGSLALAERQNRLLHALLRNEGALDQFLAFVAATDLCVRLGTSPIIDAPVKDEDEIFSKVLLDDSAKGQNLFGEAAADGQIFEETELLHQCFSVDWNGSVLTEVEVMPAKTSAKDLKDA